MSEPGRWIANDMIYLNGGTAWGISEAGATFAIGPAAVVEAALRGGEIEARLGLAIARAGAYGALPPDGSPVGYAASQGHAIHCGVARNQALRGRRGCRVSRQIRTNR